LNFRLPWVFNRSPIKKGGGSCFMAMAWVAEARRGSISAGREACVVPIPGQQRLRCWVVVPQQPPTTFRGISLIIGQRLGEGWGSRGRRLSIDIDAGRHWDAEPQGGMLANSESARM